MSYQDKMAAACQIVTQHNTTLGSDATPLDWDAIQAAIIKMGGTSEQALESATWEDLQECGIPKILARTIAAAFRKAAPPEKAGPPFGFRGSITTQRAAGLTYEALFTHYDPTGELNPAVFARLEELAGGNPVVIFDGTGKDADPTLSAKRLREVKDGHRAKDEIVVDNVVRNVYRIGESPTAFVYENPLFPGEMLRPGHICDTTERSWDGVPLEIRQTLYLAVSKTGELTISSPGDVHDVLDYVQNGSPERIAVRYPKATGLLRELKDAESAPSLRLKHGKKARQSAQANDPFFGKHRRT